MFRTMLVGIALAAAALAAPQGASEKATFDDLMRSSKAPAVLLPKNLPTDAVAFAIRMKSDSFDLAAMIRAGAGSSGEQEVLTQLLALRSLFWTRGDHMTVDGVDFLVTYRSEFSLADLMKASSESGLKKPLALGLVLLRSSEIASITPRPDITQTQLVDLASRAAGLLDEASDKAKATAALSNAKQIALALLMIAADHDDVLPYAQDTNTMVSLTTPYTKNPAVWETKNPKGGRFLFNMSLAGVALTQVQSPTETPMVFESEAWKDGRRVVAYVDGHARFVTDAEWAKLQPNLKLKLKRHGKPLPPSPAQEAPKGK